MILRSGSASLQIGAPALPEILVVVIIIMIVGIIAWLARQFWPRRQERTTALSPEEQFGDEGPSITERLGPSTELGPDEPAPIASKTGVLDQLSAHHEDEFGEWLKRHRKQRPKAKQ